MYNTRINFFISTMFIDSIILLLTIHSAISIDSCHTPDRQEGDCKPIHHCPQIYTYYRGSFANNIATFLRQSQCGNYGAYPKVCCPIDFVLPPGLPDKSECGITSESNGFDGNQTGIHEFPWSARLQYKGTNGSTEFKCGGSLISKRYVLTARDCLRNTLFSVRLGEWNTTSNPDCVVNRYGVDCAPEVLDISVLEQVLYRGRTSASNDIGLIRLSQDVKYNEFISPICLPTPQDVSQSYLDKKLVVTGWGAGEKAASSNIKLKVEVSVTSSSLCLSELRDNSRTDVSSHNGQICAGGDEEKKSCFGDNGGTLMLKENEKWYAVGIVPFGAHGGCRQRNKPRVYVKVAKYIRWITNNVN